MLKAFKSIRLLLFLTIAIMALGTVGFMLLEKLSFIDALYFTIVTITTVGYGDIHPTNIGSKVFSIVLIILGISTFLTIITNVAQIIIQRSQHRLQTRRLNMIIGIFFTEVGNELLNMLTQFDPGIGKLRKDSLLKQDSSEAEFTSLRKKLQLFEYTIDAKLMNLEILSQLLKQKGDFLLRQIENSAIMEHESFTELLWSVIHLRDELIARKNLANLSEADIAHLANDAKRAYNALSRRWLDYMLHLKLNYPYLYSLAIRTNPFSETPAAEIK